MKHRLLWLVPMLTALTASPQPIARARLPAAHAWKYSSDADSQGMPLRLERTSGAGCGHPSFGGSARQVDGTVARVG
jgi:hypothetical protein